MSVWYVTFWLPRALTIEVLWVIIYIAGEKLPSQIYKHYVIILGLLTSLRNRFSPCVICIHPLLTILYSRVWDNHCVYSHYTLHCELNRDLERLGLSITVLWWFATLLEGRWFWRSLHKRKRKCSTFGNTNMFLQVSNLDITGYT